MKSWMDQFYSTCRVPELSEFYEIMSFKSTARAINTLRSLFDITSRFSWYTRHDPAMLYYLTSAHVAICIHLKSRPSICNLNRLDVQIVRRYTYACGPNIFETILHLPAPRRERPGLRRATQAMLSLKDGWGKRGVATQECSWSRHIPTWQLTYRLRAKERQSRLYVAQLRFY